MAPGCATSTIRCMHLSRSCARLACAVRLTVPSLGVRATLPLIFRQGTQGTVSTENRSPGCGKRCQCGTRCCDSLEDVVIPADSNTVCRFSGERFLVKYHPHISCFSFIADPTSSRAVRGVDGDRAAHYSSLRPVARQSDRHDCREVLTIGQLARGRSY